MSRVLLTELAKENFEESGLEIMMSTTLRAALFWEEAPKELDAIERDQIQGRGARRHRGATNRATFSMTLLLLEYVCLLVLCRSFFSC